MWLAHCVAPLCHQTDITLLMLIQVYTGIYGEASCHCLSFQNRTLSLFIMHYALMLTSMVFSKRMCLKPTGSTDVTQER